MIGPDGQAFLGVAVNPKTWEPVFVWRPRGASRRIQIFHYKHDGIAWRYARMGAGYLESESGKQYLSATELTGYPRAHTPNGVRVEGMGYGTCLYTALVMLTAAASENDLKIDDCAGSGRAICSSAGTRSDEADRWWHAALRRGLSTRERGDDAHGDEVVADVFRLGAARSYNLIAVRTTYDGDMKDWSRDAFPGDGTPTERNRTAILALNVSKQDPIMVGQLALQAQSSGARPAEITRMLMRNKFGVDVMHPPHDPLHGAPSATQRRRNRGPAPDPEPNPPPTMPAYQRTPVVPIPTPSQQSKLRDASAELEELRRELGWYELADLP